MMKMIKEGSLLRNIDLLHILSHLELTRFNKDNLKIFDEFYDYLFKLGIETRVNNGKQLGIADIRENKVDFNELMKMDSESFIDFTFEPPFVTKH